MEKLNRLSNEDNARELQIRELLIGLDRDALEALLILVEDYQNIQESDITVFCKEGDPLLEIIYQRVVDIARVDDQGMVIRTIQQQIEALETVHQER